MPTFTANLQSTETHQNLQHDLTAQILTANVSSDKNASVVDEKLLHLQRPRSRLFRRQRGDRLADDVYVELSGIRFVRDRWMSVSKNYRLMLDDLFLTDLSSSSSSSLLRGRYGDDDSYCAILEDDLILAPDAIIYLQVSRLLNTMNRSAARSIHSHVIITCVGHNMQYLSTWPLINHQLIDRFID